MVPIWYRTIRYDPQAFTECPVNTAFYPISLPTNHERTSAVALGTWKGLQRSRTTRTSTFWGSLMIRGSIYWWFLRLMIWNISLENLTDHRIQIQMPGYTMVDNRLFLFSWIHKWFYSVYLILMDKSVYLRTPYFSTDRLSIPLRAIVSYFEIWFQK